MVVLFAGLTFTLWKSLDVGPIPAHAAECTYQRLKMYNVAIHCNIRISSSTNL